jgi:urease gamma subunit
LLVKGIHKVPDLAYVTESGLAGWRVSEAVRTLLMTARDVAAGVVEGEIRATRMKAAEAAEVMKTGRTMMAADKVAESIEPETVMVIEKSLEAEVAKYGLDKLGKSWTPAEVLTRLKEKKIAGAPVEELLDQRAEMLLFESRRNS